MVDTTLSRIKSTFNNNIKLIISDIADKYDIPVNQISDIYNTDLFKKINNKICKKYKICLKKYQRQVRDELCLQYYTENKTFDTFIRYIEIVYHKNFMNITKDNIGEIVLCQIPGISSATAMAIMKHFGSFAEFYEKIKENSGVLDEIKINTNGKERKISKTNIENIKKYLF